MTHDQVITIPSANAPLTEKAMLAGLKISSWSARRQVKQISDEAAAKHNADASQLNATKSLVAKSALEAIKKIEGSARTYHASHTRPWMDDGKRILPVALYWDYTQEMTRLRQEHETAVADFIANYPQLVADAQASLGNLYDPTEYPSPDKIAKRFDFESSMSPLPSGEDFRVSLGADEEERIRASIDSRLQEGVKQAMQDLYTQIHDTVSHMATKLRAYKVTISPDGKSTTEGIFRDSLVENLREIVALLPAMNLTNDARLAALTDRLQSELCAEDADTLRENDHAREQVATSAEDILAAMAGLIGD